MSKGQRSRSPGLFTAALTHQAAAAVSVGKYSLWEPTATLPSAGAAVGSAAPIEGEGRRHIVAAARLQLVFDVYHKTRITPAVVNILMN